ncbi:hypothetical protein [Dyella acidisoli]|uniref:Uncharacterized protein n=1 Tax=Dyella acidisoli TaxID=1867834 RepID=A0ABQ5XQH9_9GAMM|nr:hypothetical protein [Dyella acidisoli]GLQ93642.1 hypothetical protein GCM10007901_25930 [Dyella acidisoli]
MNVDYSVRQQQARALLDGLHPVRFGDLPEPLLKQALSSNAGRRHLARAAVRYVPGVFAPDHERWQCWQDEPWLQWPQSRIQAFSQTLGAIALGPALRMIVERNAVLFVRNALGIENWRYAQSANPWPESESAPEAIRNMGEAVLKRCGSDAHALSTAVLERGKIEFIGYAERRHESLAARLALAYAEVSAGSCKGSCWLPASTVPMLLAEQKALDVDSSTELMTAEGPIE